MLCLDRHGLVTSGRSFRSATSAGSTRRAALRTMAEGNTSRAERIDDALLTPTYIEFDGLTLLPIILNCLRCLRDFEKKETDELQKLCHWTAQRTGD